MASGRPAGPDLQERGMVGVSDKNAPIRPLDLRVTTQAEIGVARHQHLLVDRAVRVVAG